MVTTATRSARLRTVLGWPVGLAIVSWRYMWRTVPLHRSDETGTRADLPGFAYDTTGFADRLQPLSAGVGPVLHRLYRVRIVGTSITPPVLMDLVSHSLNKATPEMAKFRKIRGDQSALRLGDEYVVRMPGPWDGPVRVVRRGEASFRLVTLHGHLEAGEIEFRAGTDPDGLYFEIESWARAGDRLSALLYNNLRAAKEIQLNMWSHFCIRVARMAGGRPQGGITIRTRRLPWD
jgi:hypothetical protein